MTMTVNPVKVFFANVHPDVYDRLKFPVLKAQVHAPFIYETRKMHDYQDGWVNVVEVQPLGYMEVSLGTDGKLVAASPVFDEGLEKWHVNALLNAEAVRMAREAAAIDMFT